MNWLQLAVIAIGGSAAYAQAPALDTTAPRIALNQEAKDTTTKLELLQQDLAQAEQQIMFLNLLYQYHCLLYTSPSPRDS